MKSLITAYTDGASSGNPGPSGWGVVMIEGENVRELGGHFPLSTNNHMELLSVLEALKSADGPIRIFADSTYVLIGFNRWLPAWRRRGYRNAQGEPIKNENLWRELDEVARQYRHPIEWRYIPGHKGYVGNERADEIAVGFSLNGYFDLYRGKLHFHPRFPIDEPPMIEIPEPKFAGAGGAAKPKVKYYLVLTETREVKKFLTWSECESFVKGRAGVRYKKIHTSEEEGELLKSWGIR